MADSRNFIIIPARLQSTRVSRKLLRTVADKPVIVHTALRAQQSVLCDRVIVASDSEEILEVVRNEGFDGVMTSKHWRCGTERCAELVEKLDLKGNIINLQGDEMFVDPADLDRLFSCLMAMERNVVYSLMAPLGREQLNDPDTVKVLCDADLRALDFLRITNVVGGLSYRHVGVYGFSARRIKILAALEPTSSEIDRKLEQMRWLNHGISIQMLFTSHQAPSINASSDFPKALDYFNRINS